MKSFFKMVFASFVGMILAGVVGFFFLFIMIGMISSALTAPEKVAVKPNSIYRIMLDRPITERSKSGLSSNLFSFSIESSIGLNDILRTVKQATSDPNIQMIYMDLSILNIGMEHVEEVRSAIEKFKDESGKPVIAYADNYSQAAYYLATVADKIYLNPYGSASLTGMRAEVMFYKGLLDKLKIEMQVVRHGKFKSAIEPFVMDKMSDENREQYMTFINSIWRHWLEKISEARDIEPQKLNTLIDNLELEVAQNSMEYGLVDGLLYKDELLTKLCDLTGVSEEQKLSMIDVADYAKVQKRTISGKSKIAVVYADGDISMGKGEDGITAWNFANTLRAIRHDKTIKAVVFRVNSPGGSAQASEIIARELSLIKEEKPVVVSMGNYAASGGYWISAPATKIVVNTASLTGSIGVFSLIPNVKKGMNDYLGVTVDVAKSNTSADYPSVMRPMTEREQHAMQSTVELVYAQFVEKVAEARGLSKEAVDEIGQGRVWSGADAVRLGLADELGGITEAIDIAADLAGIENYRTVDYPSIRNPFEQMLESLMKGEVSIKAQMPEEVKTAEQFYKQVKEPGVYARMPFDVDFY